MLIPKNHNHINLPLYEIKYKHIIKDNQEPWKIPLVNEFNGEDGNMVS